MTHPLRSIAERVFYVRFELMELHPRIIQLPQTGIAGRIDEPYSLTESNAYRSILS